MCEKRSVLRALLEARVAASLSSAKSLSNVSHNGLKGSLREIVLRDLLAPLLPHSAGLIQGELIDSNNGVSKQQDIVIFDRQLTPALLIDRYNGIIPIEAALYTVEVKSMTSKDEITSAMVNARSVSQLRGVDENLNTEKTIPCLFAFDSDLAKNGKTELQRYKEIDKNSSPLIRSICIVGRGYWYFSNNDWNEIEATPNYDEVIQFMSGILNTYNRVFSTRASRSFQQYLD